MRRTMFVGLAFLLSASPLHAAPETLYWEDLMPPEGEKALEEAYAAAAAAAERCRTPAPASMCRHHRPTRLFMSRLKRL